LPGVAERALDPPGRVARKLDARLADEVADLPWGTPAVDADVEVGRDAEVALTPGGEADVATDARHAERADVLPVEVLSDHVPAAVVGQQAVRIDRPFALPVSRNRVVRELDRALLGDRSFELAEPAGHLRRVVGIEHLDSHCRLACRLV